MAKVLLLLQLIVGIVVLPLWPGLQAQYLCWGALYLVFVLGLPAASVVAVHGVGALRQALVDAWATRPLGPESVDSASCWRLLLACLPAAALLGGLVALSAALGHLDPLRPLPVQALTAAFFCLVWGFLGFLFGRVFQEIVERLSHPLPSPLLVLTEAIAQLFGLTPREAEVAQAVLDGLTYKQTAERLFISPATVKSHVLSVYQKTGAGNKMELLRMVEARGDRIHQRVDGGKRPLGGT